MIICMAFPAKAPGPIIRIERRRYTHSDITSGAGHDACNVHRAAVPTAMIFIPSIGQSRRLGILIRATHTAQHILVHHRKHMYSRS